MDDYKRLAQGVLVPSLFLLLFISSLILCADGIALGIPAETIAGAALFLCAALLLPLIVRLSLPASACRSRAAACLGLALCAIALSAYPAFRLLSLRACAAPGENDFRPQAVVESAEDLRYNRELVLRFAPKTPARVPFFKNGVRALVYAAPECDLGEGDEITLLCMPRFISREDCSRSPFLRSAARAGFRIFFRLRGDDFLLTRRAPETLRSLARRAIEENIDRLFDRETGALVKSLYFGSAHYLRKSTICDFKRAGVMHILAASGFNVGIVASIPLFLCSLFKLSRRYVLVLTIIPLYFYLYIANMPVSLLRAVIMYSLYALQRFFDLDRNILNTLFLSAVVILAACPHELYAPGFQLSFGASAGIVALYRIYRRLVFASPALLGDSLALTLSAQVLVYPVILFHMREVNLTGIVSNVLIIPATSLIFVLSMAANAVLPVWEGLASLIAALGGFSYGLTLHAVRLLASFPGHFRIDIAPPLLVIPFCLYLLPLALRRRRAAGALSLCSAFLIAWLMLAGWSRTAAPSRTLLLSSVAAVCRSDGRALVYGNIASFDDAKKIVTHLRQAGADNVEILITHPDYRNLSHFAYILRQSVVSRCAVGSGYRFSSAMGRFCRLLDREGLRLEILKSSRPRTRDPGDLARRAEELLDQRPAQDTILMMMRNSSSNLY